MNSGSDWFWISRRTPRVVFNAATRAISGSSAAPRSSGRQTTEPFSARVALRDLVDPIRLVEILRHVDVDFDEDEAFQLIRFGRAREIVGRPVALQRGRAGGPGVAETFLIEQMDVRIDDREFEHANSVVCDQATAVIASGAKSPRAPRR